MLVYCARTTDGLFLLWVWLGGHAHALAGDRTGGRSNVSRTRYPHGHAATDNTAHYSALAREIPLQR